MKLFLSFSLTITFIFWGTNEASAQKFSKKLDNYIKGITANLGQVSAERRATLKKIGDYVYTELKANKKAQLLAICTHNSRRSQIAQTWIATAALYYGIQGVEAYSGGTEATAFNKNAIAGLKRAGFFTVIGAGKNPKVMVATSSNAEAWTMFSKKFTNWRNPQSNFGGIMVCSDADKACPVVPGAAQRFSLPFNDPRHFDNTSAQNAKYDETVKKIAQEMFLMMKYVRDKVVLKKNN